MQDLSAGGTEPITNISVVSSLWQVIIAVIYYYFEIEVPRDHTLKLLLQGNLYCTVSEMQQGHNGGKLDCGKPCVIISHREGRAS